MADLIWDLPIPRTMGLFDPVGRQVVGEAVAIADEQSLVIPPTRSDQDAMRLSPADKSAALYCRTARGRVLIRVAEPSAGQVLAECLKLPVTVDHPQPRQIYCSDDVLDREGRRLRTRRSQALRALHSEFVLRVSGRNVLVRRVWPDGNQELLGANGRVADLVLREGGLLLVRVRRHSESGTDLPPVTAIEGTFEFLDGQGVSTRLVAVPSYRDPRLLPLYLEALVGEVREYAARLLSAGLMPVHRRPDPTSGLPRWFVKPCENEELAVLPSAQAAQMYDRLVPLMTRQGVGRENLGDVLDALLAARPVRVAVDEDGLIGLASQQEGLLPADAVAVDLEYRGLIQARRRFEALSRVSRDGVEGPIAVMLGARRPYEFARTPKAPSRARIRRALGVDPTFAQERAIRAAVTTPDVVLIQGPPGTGKTRVIAAIRTLLDEAESTASSGAQTLLASTQHEAVDNLVASQTRHESLPAYRFRARDDNYDDQVAQWGRAWKDRLPRVDADDAVDLFPEVSRLYSLAMADGLSALPVVRSQLESLLRGRVSGEDLDRLLSALTPSRVSRLSGEAELLVRLIRTDRVPYADDGQFTLQRIISSHEVRARLREQDTALLEDLVRTGRSPTTHDFRRLEGIRTSLLDAQESLGVPREARQALERLLEDLKWQRAEFLGDVGAVGRELRERLGADSGGVLDVIRTFSDARASTCQVAANVLVEENSDEGAAMLFENVIVDEASRTPPADLLVVGQRARRRLILVGDQKQLPHFIDQSVQNYLDSKQLSAYARPLFQELQPHLRDLERLDGVVRTVALSDQFRMHPRLGAFVSRAFYEPEVRLSSPRPESDFAGSLPGFADRVAVWLHVPPGPASRRNGSWSSGAEAQKVREAVVDLLRENSSITVGVLSFYRAQIDLISESMEGAGDLDDVGRLIPSLNPSDNPDRLWIGTVDAAQGREFDCVVLSMVRSSGSGDGRFGHLSDAQRMCVAFSRARRGLALVGDRGHFSSARAKTEVPWVAAFLQLCREESDRHA